jgi:hypothetical protein
MLFITEVVKKINGYGKYGLSQTHMHDFAFEMEHSCRKRLKQDFGKHFSAAMLLASPANLTVGK